MTPEGWRRCQLGEVLVGIDAGWSPQCRAEPAGVDEWGVLKVSAVSTGTYDDQENKALPADLAPRPSVEVRVGDLLLARASGVLELVGRVARVRETRPRLMLSDKILRLRCRPAEADEGFLHATLQSGAAREALLSGTGGSHMRNVSQAVLQALPVALPPLREQKKIAAILSSVDDAIASTQAVIDQLDIVKKAMMAELLTRGIPGRHTKFKMTEIGEVPAGWAIRPCGELFDVQLGKMMSVGARAGAHQFPYLRNENVYWHRLALDDVATMHFEPAEREKFRLRVGDLLACEGRHIGRCAIWEGQIDECYFQKALHRLRSKSGVVTTAYMQFFMMLRFRFMTDLVAEANATSTIPHLPQEKLLRLPIWFPQREEQDEIAHVLSTLSRRESAETKQLGALRELKSALMSVLLTGEVRVSAPVVGD